MARVILVAALLLALSVAAHGAPPKPPVPTQVEPLPVSRDHLRAGEDVKVTGYGCPAGDEVRFELYNPQLASSATGVTDSNGTFIQLIRVPSSARIGRAWLRASCATESGDRILEAILLITRPKFLITWVNVLFGLATSLTVGGFLLDFIPRRKTSRSYRRRSSKRRRSRHRTARRVASI